MSGAQLDIVNHRELFAGVAMLGGTRVVFVVFCFLTWWGSLLGFIFAAEEMKCAFNTSLTIPPHLFGFAAN